ncbi:coronin-1C-like [Pocillopora verrucosa]|uniref:coronin-1C-like n=1 Tax=Pocillopora verrucosa TaxID=203993 RepID=UPI002796F126|nr:coronin-1C-like [Pocillopora verrucosa]
MAKFVRSSKFRHVFGTAAKKDKCYEGFQVSGNSVDSAYCAVNPKFLAIILKAAGGGAFLVLRHDEVGRLDPEHGRVAGHTQDVLDVAWNPFDDNMVASSSEDTTVKIWQIEDEGLGKVDKCEPLLSLEGFSHQRKVHQILWHPVASNVLLSASFDPKIVIWNLDSGEAAIEIDCHPDLIQSVSWNSNGSRIVTSCKDKKIRIIDVRKNEVVCEQAGHEGAKPQRVAFCSELNYIFSVGFSKMSARQYAVWKADTLENLALEEIDQSNSVPFIHYDPDTLMIYLAGKGDSIIRYYELAKEHPHCHWLTNYSSNVPQRGVCYMPKRGCDVTSNEVAKCFKLVAKGYCEPVSFTVPRKSELFQKDLFPDTQGDEPSLLASDWFEGQDAEPKKVSLDPGDGGGAKGANKPKKGLRGLGKMAPKKKEAKADDDEVELVETVKQLKLKVEEQEKRIKALEDKVGV